MQGAVLPQTSTRPRRLTGPAAARRRARRLPSRGVALGAVLVCTFGAQAADAQVTVKHTSYAIPQVWNSGDARLVQLSPSGATSLAVISVRPERVQVTFTAECQVSSTDAGTWLGIQIYLSGQLLAPTGTSFAFCTSDGTPGGGWSTASTTLTFDVPPPAVANSLTVEARLFPFDEGETARLDDVQLTVVQVLGP